MPPTRIYGPSEKDLSIKRVTSMKKIPINDDERAERCTSVDGCGTVYECNEGFCTLRRNDETFEVEEQDFISRPREKIVPYMIQNMVSDIRS